VSPEQGAKCDVPLLGFTEQLGKPWLGSERSCQRIGSDVRRVEEPTAYRRRQMLQGSIVFAEEARKVNEPIVPLAVNDDETFQLL
jgi:hypothetical protein